MRAGLVTLFLVGFTLTALAQPPRPVGGISELDQSVRECVMLKYTGVEDGSDPRLTMKYEDINELRFTFSEPGCRWTVTGHARVPSFAGIYAFTQFWVCVNQHADGSFFSSFITHKRLYLH